MRKYILFFVLAMCHIGFNIQAKGTKLPDSYAFTRGVEAYQEGNLQDALDWFNKEITDNPDNGYAYLYVAFLRYRNDEYGRALSAINQALKNLPKKDNEYNAATYYTRGMIYFTLEDTVAGLKDYDTAIKLEPENAKHYDRRAQIYFEQGKYDLADADYNQMIRLDSGDIMGYMGLGRNAKEQGRYEEAIEKFNQVIRMEPDYSSGYSFRAEANIGLENWKEATDDLVKALDIDRDDKAFYLMVDLPEDASQLMKSKLKIQMSKQPGNRYWPYCIAMIYQTKEEYEEAIEYFQQAHKLDANSIFLEKIAQSYQGLRQYDKALDYANQALAMSPEDYEVIDLKANILSRLGRLDESLEERNKVIAQFPENTFFIFPGQKI